MEHGIFTHQTRSLTVATPVYEGPLALLLQLIERAELDITRLALAQVTDQFLAHIQQIQNLETEEVSAFLVIAARLIQIKSEALLPRPPQREEGEEDPGEALARQLLEYKKYKQATQWLSLREASGLRTYLRIAPPPKIEGTLDLSGLTLEKLSDAAMAIFNRADYLPPLGTVVPPPRVTIREKISLIARFLHNYSKIKFLHLFRGPQSRLDIVVMFLAMLELIKRQIIHVKQENLFGDIEIERTGELDEADSIDLEFGE